MTELGLVRYGMTNDPTDVSRLIPLYDAVAYSARQEVGMAAAPRACHS